MTVVIIGVMFVVMAQPMSLVMLLMLVTLYYSLEVFSEKMTFWFSFIIMIVMISGILVVFSYMASLSPNESFEASWAGMMVVFFMWVISEYKWGESVSYSSLKLWENSVMEINIFMVSFLLMIMVAVVWVSSWSVGAVRVN